MLPKATDYYEAKSNANDSSLAISVFSYTGLTMIFHASGSFLKLYNSIFLTSAVISSV